jgi:signal transduction histidine kinase
MPGKLEGELAEAQTLIQHLIASGEQDKAELARKLHDEIAELMVAALMDLTAATPHLPNLDGRAEGQLARAKATLGAAILTRVDGWSRNCGLLCSKRSGYLQPLNGRYKKQHTAQT